MRNSINRNINLVLKKFKNINLWGRECTGLVLEFTYLLFQAGYYDLKIKFFLATRLKLLRKVNDLLIEKVNFQKESLSLLLGDGQSFLKDGGKRDIF